MRFPFGPDEQESPNTSQALASAVVETEPEIDELLQDDQFTAQDDELDLSHDGATPELSCWPLPKS